MMRTLSIVTVLAAAVILPAFARDSISGPGSTTAAPSARQGSIFLTSQEALAWIDKSVYSSDGKKIGEVAAVQRGDDNKVIEMHANTGGFLGLGETRVKLLPAQFKLTGDRVVLELTAAQAKDLPKAAQ